MSDAPLRVLVFAGLRARAGRESLDVHVPRPATVAELRAALESQYPELGSLDHCRIAVDQAFADDDTPVDDAEELALIPPVSGGADIHYGERSALSRTTLSLDAVLEGVRHDSSGGICTFTGQVRRQSRGKQVEYLEYDAYPAMALKVMDQIAAQIEERIPGSKVRIHHRYGRLEVGEDAVVIAASAPHRAEAFEACREAIESLKRDVPIWKKEVDDQGGEWIGQGP
jgi:molybdopterin synthase catalytic subunit